MPSGKTRRVRAGERDSSSSEAADSLRGPRTERSWTLLPSGTRLPSRRQASGYIWASGKRLKVMLRLKWLSTFIRFISLYSLGSCSYNNIFGWKRKNVLLAAISATITKGNWACASSRRPLARLPIHFLGFSLFRFAGRSNFTSLSVHWKTLFLAVINAAYNVHCCEYVLQYTCMHYTFHYR